MEVLMKRLDIISVQSSGTLIIFPAYLVHGSQPNVRVVDRLTLAANFFPFGNQNIGGWDVPMMNLEKKDVK
ncbi:MAG: hypothetical protein CM15mV6_1750 [uncultured marine virus]|nr:MAG: hypothetical protein CM15mV6_1750 [uncultured marine virus]